MDGSTETITDGLRKLDLEEQSSIMVTGDGRVRKLDPEEESALKRSFFIHDYELNIDPVNEAIETDDVATLRLLLKDPAIVETINQGAGRYTPPIHTACTRKNIDLVKALLDTGKVDLTVRDFKGCTPIHIAARNGDIEKLKYFLDTYCKEGKDYIRKELVDSCALYSQTPLHCAVRGQNPRAVVPYLLEKGACGYYLDQNDMMALEYCEERDDIWELLFKHVSELWDSRQLRLSRKQKRKAATMKRRKAAAAMMKRRKAATMKGRKAATMKG